MDYLKEVKGIWKSAKRFILVSAVITALLAGLWSLIGDWPVVSQLRFLGYVWQVPEISLGWYLIAAVGLWAGIIVWYAGFWNLYFDDEEGKIIIPPGAGICIALIALISTVVLKAGDYTINYSEGYLYSASVILLIVSLFITMLLRDLSIEIEAKKSYLSLPVVFIGLFIGFFFILLLGHFGYGVGGLVGLLLIGAVLSWLVIIFSRVIQVIYEFICKALKIFGEIIKEAWEWAIKPQKN